MFNSQISNKISNSLSIGKQVGSSSHSTLLSSRVEFAPSGNEESLNISELKGKYHQFGNENSNKHMNGQLKYSRALKASQNGNREDDNKNLLEGIPVPRIQIFNPARVQLEWHQNHKIGAGLVNLGNTCFMNTVIQCLTYCVPLTNYLLHDEDHTYKCKLVGFCMICELQKHIKRALEKHGQAIKPMYIYQKLKAIAKHFQFGRQEDAHEFLRYVIDNLWKASLANYEGASKLDPTSKETTVVNHIFGGYNRSQVVCLMCHGRSNTYDHFMDFILDIKNVSSLEGALKKFVEPEMLEDDNAYKCPKCGTKVRAEKKFTVHRPPNVATFQFKRFDYNRMFGGKITKPVSYPEKLDLRPYMSENKGSPVQYRLNAVLVHMGHTCNSGHYYCYVLNSNGLWYLMDDARVHQVSLNQVLAQQAYVLFYVRVPTQNKIANKKLPIATTCNNKIVKNGPLGHASLEPSTAMPRSPYHAHLPSAHSCLSSNSSLNSMVASPPLLNGTVANRFMTNGNRPALILSNGRSNCHINNHLTNVTSRERISFDIKRPQQQSPAIDRNDSNGNQVDDNSNKPDLGVIVKRKDVTKTPPPAVVSGKTTLVPYDVKDSSSSSDDEKPLTPLVNGHNKKVPLNEIPLPGESNNKSSGPKLDKMSPKLLSLGIRSLSDSNVVRTKATNSWHVCDDRLQSPSIASGSSNNSVSSTTDWTVMDTDSAKVASPHVIQRAGCTSTPNKLPIWSIKSREAESSLKDSSLPGLATKTNSHLSCKHKERKFLSNVSVSGSVCDVITELDDEVKERLVIPEVQGEVPLALDVDRLAPTSLLGRGEPSRCERQSCRDSSTTETLPGTSSGGQPPGNAHRKRRNEPSLSDETRHCAVPKKCKDGSDTTGSCRQQDNECDRVLINEVPQKNNGRKRSRRDSSCSSSSSSTGSYEWIEKTKETLGGQTNVDVKSWDPLSGKTDKVCDAERKLDDLTVNTKHTDTVNELLGMAGNSYGNAVMTWDGGRSSGNANEMEGNCLYKKFYSDDDYNDELDAGKVKKLKKRYSEPSGFAINRNPFQQVQDFKRQQQHNNQYKDRYSWYNGKNSYSSSNRNNYQQSYRGNGYRNYGNNSNNGYHYNYYQGNNSNRYYQHNQQRGNRHNWQKYNNRYAR